MKTRLKLDMHHNTSVARVFLTKEFEGGVVPPFRHEELNFRIAIDLDESTTLEAEVQSMAWYPEEGVVEILTAYIYYERVNEMEHDATVLRAIGWR